MDKKALINSGRLQFPLNDRTDKNFIAQPKINLQSFESTPDSLKQRFKAFGRKLLNIVLRCFVSSASVIRHFNTQKNYDARLLEQTEPLFSLESRQFY